MLRQRARDAVAAATSAYNALDFSTALEATLAITGRANQYLEERAPWTLLKKASAQQAASSAMELASYNM